LAQAVLRFGCEEADIVELDSRKGSSGHAVEQEQDQNRLNALEEDELLSLLNADFGFPC
jgi:hypothetical protein